MLTADVNETDIPCLLSKNTMIKSNMILDMTNNTIDRNMWTSRKDPQTHWRLSYPRSYMAGSWKMWVNL